MTNCTHTDVAITTHRDEIVRFADGTSKHFSPPVGGPMCKLCGSESEPYDREDPREVGYPSEPEVPLSPEARAALDAGLDSAKVDIASGRTLEAWEPEAREPAPPAERAPDEPCKCGKQMLPPLWESVTDSGDRGTDYLRHSRTACLTATERASQAKAAAPPAAEGLTAEECLELIDILAIGAHGGPLSAANPATCVRLLPRVRAAAEKAGGR